MMVHNDQYDKDHEREGERERYRGGFFEDEDDKDREGEGEGEEWGRVRSRYRFKDEDEDQEEREGEGVGSGWVLPRGRQWLEPIGSIVGAIALGVLIVVCIRVVLDWRAEHTTYEDPYAKYSFPSRSAPPQSGQSNATPSVTSTPTPSPSPSISAPVKPADMALFDQRGAEATAKYFLASVAYGWNTGDVSPLEELCKPDTFCTSARDHITHVYADGLTASDAKYTYGNVMRYFKSDAPGRGPNTYVLMFDFDEHTAAIHGNGEDHESKKKHTVTTLIMEWSTEEETWHVLGGKAWDYDNPQ